VVSVRASAADHIFLHDNCLQLQPHGKCVICCIGALLSHFKQHGSHNRPRILPIVALEPGWTQSTFKGSAGSRVMLIQRQQGSLDPRARSLASEVHAHATCDADVDRRPPAARGWPGRCQVSGVMQDVDFALCGVPI
jgi:hypothetical protein